MDLSTNATQQLRQHLITSSSWTTSYNFDILDNILDLDILDNFIIKFI